MSTISAPSSSLPPHVASKPAPPPPPPPPSTKSDSDGDHDGSTGTRETTSGGSSTGGQILNIQA